MRITEMLDTLRKRWLVIVVATVIVAIVPSLLPEGPGPQYTVTAEVIVRDGITPRAAALIPRYSQSIDRNTQMITALMRSENVAKAAVEELGLDIEYWEVAERMSATYDSSTNVITIEGTGDDPQQTADITNAVVNAISVALKAQQERYLNEAIATMSKLVTEADKQLRYFEPVRLSPSGEWLQPPVIGQDTSNRRHEDLDNLILAMELAEDPVVVIRSAQAPEPVAPNMFSSKKTAFGAALGITLGVLIAIFLEYVARERATMESGVQ